jgi:hypothetical protein
LFDDAARYGQRVEVHLFAAMPRRLSAEQFCRQLPTRSSIGKYVLLSRVSWGEDWVGRTAVALDFDAEPNCASSP